MAQQPTAGESWLYDCLSGDATLTGLVGSRIVDRIAERGQDYPLVVFQFQGGHDVMGVAAARLLGQEVFLVKAVGRAPSYATLKPIAKRIDELLHKAHGETDDGKVRACVREQPFKMVELIDGIEYRHLGGLYRLYMAGS